MPAIAASAASTRKMIAVRCVERSTKTRSTVMLSTNAFGSCV